MVTLSLCMIVRDEEDVLERCLKSIKDIVDEIIIVDTGSIDKTKEIALKYTDKLYHFEWIDNFAAARNFSFSKAEKDFVMWLDADDVIWEEDIKKLKELKEELSNDTDYVTMIYNLDFDEFGNVNLSNRRIRLVNRLKNYKWYGAVHECFKVQPEDKLINSDVCVTHKKLKSSGNRNIQIYSKRLKEGKEFTPRDYYCYANELLCHKDYNEAIENYEKYLELEASYSDKINAASKLADCYFNVKKFEKAKIATLKSFVYGIPRAEQCCKLGFYFFMENRIDCAVYWYDIATKLSKPEGSWEFFNDACWTWLPHIQLSICYIKLGDYEKAYEHNNIAKDYRPQDEAILFSENLIKKLISKSKE